MDHVLHECVVGCPILSSTYEHVSRFIIAARASISYCNQACCCHPTCASCAAWMCGSCRMSNSIKQVWACPDLSFDRLVLYAFLHFLRSNFSPSRPLQLWFEAACETSLARDIYAKSTTQKSRRGRYSFIVCLSVLSYWMISVRDKKHGTCLRNGRGCAAWALILNCKHVVVSDTSSNLCIMCCMNVL